MEGEAREVKLLYVFGRKAGEEFSVKRDSWYKTITSGYEC